MDTLAKLIICAVLGAFYSPTQAATYAPSWGELKVINGDLHMTRGNGTTSIMYPDAGFSKDLNVSTSKGNFPVPVEKSFPIQSSKVGAAAVRFLKVLPAVSTAVALYDLVCSEGGVCFDQDTGSFISSDSIPDGYPPTTAQGYWYEMDNSSYRGPTPESVCELEGFKRSFSVNWNHLEFVGLKTVTDKPYSYSCYYVDNSSSPPGPQFSRGRMKRSEVSCAPGYLLVEGVCTYQASTHATSEEDWATAETKLSAKPLLTSEALYNSDAPVPVDASTQSSPVTKQISQTSTQTKDELGNVTGTQVETKTVKVEDTSTATEVTYNVTEITTITNYNENNQITGTQTSTADTEQPKAAEDTDISFDKVSDVQLDTEEIDVQLETPVSWGEGACPPDETLTLQGRSYSVSYEPACEAAADLRPIFVLLASVTALFIVAGVSRSRGE